MSKSYIDLGFIVPLKEEFDRLEARFKRKKEFVDDVQFYSELDLGAEFSAMAFLQDDMGTCPELRSP